MVVVCVWGVTQAGEGSRPLGGGGGAWGGGTQAGKGGQAGEAMCSG